MSEISTTLHTRRNGTSMWALTKDRTVATLSKPTVASFHSGTAFHKLRVKQSKKKIIRKTSYKKHEEWKYPYTQLYDSFKQRTSNRLNWRKLVFLNWNVVIVNKEHYRASSLSRFPTGGNLSSSEWTDWKVLVTTYSAHKDITFQAYIWKHRISKKGFNLNSNKERTGRSTTPNSHSVIIFSNLNISPYLADQHH